MQPVCDATDAGDLFTAYRDRIRRYILGMVRDPAEAEDLTQETFLRAHRRVVSQFENKPNSARSI
jgi:DNA-directed RNA polymerase specialized sigma24 family protein